MKVPLSWLKQFLDLSVSTHQIADKLTLLGIEVEKIHEKKFTFKGVVVGKVLHVEKHPNADRLKVATVFDGTENFQVVCGAPNCKEGIIVAFAPIGSQLTDIEGKEWKIKRSKIRDVESFGMLCSEKELGFSEEHTGISELSSEFTLGTDLCNLYDETIFEISLTPNLGHCLSILGIARELSAAFQLPIKNAPAVITTEGSHPFQVTVDDYSACPRYTCALISGVKVGPSPSWLATRLQACGIGSINNVVDIANYIMLETGQPMHIFDASKIDGHQINITSSSETTSFLTLDGKERLIPSGTILISDRSKPLAIAGIMGGHFSAVTDDTVDILIESAAFCPSSIRKASRLLGLKTDASYRFDRGVDSGAVDEALRKACNHIREVAGGSVKAPLIDYQDPLLKPKQIVCRTARVNTLLGTQLSQSEIVECLERLEMKIVLQQHDLLVTPPSYRNDITIEEDLIEEVARIYGYNNLPPATPRFFSSSLPDAPIYTFEKIVGKHLLEEGLQECITCDLISPDQACLGLEKSQFQESHIKVLQPSSIDQSVLRSSLLPGLLKVVQNNSNVSIHNIRAFEIGRIHFKEASQYKEHSCLGIILSGYQQELSWNSRQEPFDFYLLKGMIENLFEKLGIEHFTCEPSHLNSMHPGRQAKIKIGDVEIGTFGELHPELLQTAEISSRAYFAELSLHDLFPFKRGRQKMVPLCPYPSSSRDWTIQLKETLPLSIIFNAIEEFKGNLLENFRLLNIYKSEQLGKDLKNVTFRFIYRDLNKTLDLMAVEKEHERITQAVAKKLQDSLV
jgi:phenylalanyl-tRNA synthetase beta chain